MLEASIGMLEALICMPEASISMPEARICMLDAPKRMPEVQICRQDGGSRPPGVERVASICMLEALIRMLEASLCILEAPLCMWDAPIRIPEAHICIQDDGNRPSWRRACGTIVYLFVFRRPSPTAPSGRVPTPREQCPRSALSGARRLLSTGCKSLWRGFCQAH